MNLHEQIRNLFNEKKITPHAHNKFKETGDQMIKEINSLEPNIVLDVGCGNNIYKNKIKNVIGVDILDNNLQDVNAPIEDLPFDDNYADVILALGSINFGTDIIIDKQLAELKRVSKNKTKIYFRVISNHNLEPYYNWTMDKILNKTAKHKLKLLHMPKYIYRTRRSYKEHDARTGYRTLSRLFCVWEVCK